RSFLAFSRLARQGGAFTGPNLSHVRATRGGHSRCNDEGSMKQALTVAAPLLTLLLVGLAACEDASSNPGTIPSSPDGGFGVDGGEEPIVNNCPEPTGAPVKH